MSFDGIFVESWINKFSTEWQIKRKKATANRSQWLKSHNDFAHRNLLGNSVAGSIDDDKEKQQKKQNWTWNMHEMI